MNGALAGHDRVQQAGHEQFLPGLVESRPLSPKFLAGSGLQLPSLIPEVWKLRWADDDLDALARDPPGTTASLSEVC